MKEYMKKYTFDFSDFELTNEKNKELVIEAFKQLWIQKNRLDRRGEKQSNAYISLIDIYHCVRQFWAMNEIEEGEPPTIDEVEEYLEDAITTNPADFKKTKIGYRYIIEKNPSPGEQ